MDSPRKRSHGSSRLFWKSAFERQPHSPCTPPPIGATVAGAIAFLVIPGGFRRNRTPPGGRGSRVMYNPISLFKHVVVRAGMRDAVDHDSPSLPFEPEEPLDAITDFLARLHTHQHEPTWPCGNGCSQLFATKTDISSLMMGRPVWVPGVLPALTDLRPPSRDRPPGPRGATHHRALPFGCYRRGGPGEENSLSTEGET